MRGNNKPAFMRSWQFTDDTTLCRLARTGDKSDKNSDLGFAVLEVTQGHKLLVKTY